MLPPPPPSTTTTTGEQRLGFVDFRHCHIHTSTTATTIPIKTLKEIGKRPHKFKILGPSHRHAIKGACISDYHVFSTFTLNQTRAATSAAATLYIGCVSQTRDYIPRPAISTSSQWNVVENFMRKDTEGGALRKSEKFFKN